MSIWTVIVLYFVIGINWAVMSDSYDLYELLVITIGWPCLLVVTIACLIPDVLRSMPGVVCNIGKAFVKLVAKEGEK